MQELPLMGDQPPTITQLGSSPELSEVFFSMFELIVLVLWSLTASLLSSAWLPGTAFVILCFILKFCALVSYVLLFISSLCLLSESICSVCDAPPVSICIPASLCCSLCSQLYSGLYFAETFAFFISYCVILPPAHWFLYSGHWTFLDYSCPY